MHCKNGQCVSICTGNLRFCGESCVDTLQDNSYCTKEATGCGSPCGSEQACVAGECVDNCVAPNKICSGTCVNTNTSVLHCGGCIQICSFSSRNVKTHACVEGLCKSLQCETGYANCNEAMETNYSLYDGCEVRIRDNSAHCGACNQNCHEKENANLQTNGASCGAYKCSVKAGKCQEGFADCNGLAQDYAEFDGCEVNINEPENCGGCGNNCAAKADAHVKTDGAVCTSERECKVSSNGCENGWTDCTSDAKPYAEFDGCESNFSQLNLKSCTECLDGYSPINASNVLDGCTKGCTTIETAEFCAAAGAPARIVSIEPQRAIASDAKLTIVFKKNGQSSSSVPVIQLETRPGVFTTITKGDEIGSDSRTEMSRIKKQLLLDALSSVGKLNFKYEPSGICLSLSLTFIAGKITWDVNLAWAALAPVFPACRSSSLPILAEIAMIRI